MKVCNKCRYDHELYPDEAERCKKQMTEPITPEGPSESDEDFLKNMKVMAELGFKVTLSTEQMKRLVGLAQGVASVEKHFEEREINIIYELSHDCMFAEIRENAQRARWDKLKRIVEGGRDIRDGEAKEVLKKVLVEMAELESQEGSQK